MRISDIMPINFGRFMSPDPYKASAGGPGDPRDPQSWNRYAYSKNDPITYNDPSGWCASVPVFGGKWSDEGDPPPEPGEPVPGDPCGQPTNPDPGCYATQGLSGVLTYWCLHGTGNPDVAQIYTDVKALQKALKGDPQCAKWLGQHAGKGGLNKAISKFTFGAANGITYNTGFSGPPVAATAGDVSAYDIVINDQGSFFTGSQGQQFDILIHEIAHLLNVPGFGADLGNASQEAAEEALIETNCGKTIGGN
jgi:hypothetical protein